VTTPRLSIIVPMLDEAPGIAATLRALRPLAAEIIAVDGGSSDDTLAVATPHADRVIVTSRGRARQMNAGVALARGEVLLFLHADTMLPAEAGPLVAAAIVGGARWGRFDVRIAGASPLFPLIAALMNLRSRLTGIATGDQAIFVHRDLFAAVGGFPDQPLMEDIALSARLRRIARPACLRPPVTTSGRRWEKHGVLRTILTMWQLRLRYFFGASPDVLAREYGYVPEQT
jgi:rSAM/selenodomain-associated transferase 2